MAFGAPGAAGAPHWQPPMQDRRKTYGWLPDGSSFYAPLGEMLSDGDERVCCHLCGRWMKAVGGTHLRWHGWTIDEYREAFRLGRQTPTCAPSPDASPRRERLEARWPRRLRNAAASARCDSDAAGRVALA